MPLPWTYDHEDVDLAGSMVPLPTEVVKQPPMGLINCFQAIGAIVLAYVVLCFLVWGVARAIDMYEASW